MCGIVGIVDNKPIILDEVRRMSDIIDYRGPDGQGQVVAQCGSWYLGLGHRRLAIIDLSDKASQPMYDSERKVCIVYNGEIYNFQELRVALSERGYKFLSTSDTEVVLNAYREWGIACISKFNGMFAFALWDIEQGKLYLARDRYGIKPLYYFSNGSLIFGSEIKVIMETGRVSKRVDYSALNEYFTFQNVFSDRTLFDSIKMLPMGCFMEIDLKRSELQPKISRYWHCTLPDKVSGESKENLADETRRLFIRAVNRQLVSDVPIGSYLSGGIDTGSIAVVAQKSLGRICTFTCGFDMSSVSGIELGYDEREEAEALANLIKSEQYEVVLHAGDMEAILPDLVWHLEDLRVGQCYPDFYATKLAGRFVKVVLSGMGGDELFGGYPWRYYQDNGISDMSEFISHYYKRWQRLVKDEDKEWCFNYGTWAKMKDYPPLDILGGVVRDICHDANSIDGIDVVNTCILFEMRTFLHGLFVVTDKISMGHSLEVRVPFLDNDLVDFAMQIPSCHKVVGIKNRIVDENALAKRKAFYQQTSNGKLILRLAMRSLLSQEVLVREKKGFSAPDGTWFRGESMEYVRQTLLSPTARVYEYMNKPYIEKCLTEHMEGKKNHRLFIWSLLCFEHWLRRFL